MITSAAGFAELRDPWTRLADRCDQGSVFLSHEWLEAAWQWRQQAASLYVLACFAGDALVAALPLTLERVALRGITFREAAFLAVPDSQRCDVLVAPELAHGACAALARELLRRRREWDVLRVRHVSPASRAASGLRDALSAAGLHTHLANASGNPFIDLGATWSAYYATRGRRLKKAANLAANRLARAGSVRIARYDPERDESAHAEWVDRAIAVSARSWKTDTGNSLDHPGPQAFIRHLARSAAARRWLSIWLLFLDERPVAMEYQLVADGDVFALRSDFDAAYDEISPGSHLNRHMLEQLFGAGLHRYYMGPGGNPYKLRWTETIEPLCAMTAYSRTLKGRALDGWESSLKPALVRLRARIAPAPAAVAEPAHD